MTPALAAVDRILREIREAPWLDCALVARLLGTALHETGDTGYFRIYEAEGMAGQGVALGAELREPMTGSGATAGAMLILRLSGTCIGQAEVQARYAPLALVQIPRGASLDEETVWAREEHGGSLAFGFSARRPDCLSTIVFTKAAVSPGK